MSSYGSRQFEVENPHWSVPFRLGGLNGAAFVNEQDSDADVVDCIKTIVAFPIGWREDLPDFGIVDLLFRQSNLSIASQLWSAISRWEPRAETTVQAHIDTVNELTEIITVQARGRTSA